ncbi:toxic anion resistance protein [Enterococcus sp. MMGLQ5-2]|nr:toxic anion resistance protein [Enterococcus sp. MMGLQ5-2]MBS7584228.1 toxic anion resistance protein [Enterococcus sp. MMGLQ5-1]NPD12084.1 toxic anion resistance protein [Enterococcus sp. MMGLQ5-1]NPD36656.1 toxic anion resistance protein [Enterococcus sp. MMGLQ5-2]
MEKNMANEILADLMKSDIPVETSTLPQEQQQEIKAMQETNRVAKSYETLSKEELEQAKILAKTIDESNSQAVIQYGANAQNKLAEFSNGMLTQVNSQEIGPVGDVLNELMFKLQEANPDELVAQDSNIFKKIFGKVKQSIFEITQKYQKIGASIDKVAIKLNHEKEELLKSNTTLDGLYKQNLDYFNALNVFIAAADLKKDELETQTIPEALAKANETGNQMDMQIVSDLRQFVDRLDKRSYDLKLARQITIQQAPQIRLIQNTNQALAEKIQTSINTAIPLWKNQVAIALTLLKQKEAITAQRQVSETTNELLTKNSEMLKTSSIEAARENERGVVDIETLRKTQNDLVETIQETLRIQEDGRTNRRNAEVELAQMEEELKQKLLEVSQTQNGHQ